MKKPPQRKPQAEKHLGDFSIAPLKFEKLSSVLKELELSAFKKLNDRQKGERIHKILLELIRKTPGPCFLLPAVLDFIDHVNALKVFDAYALFHFELWLNQLSGVSEGENAEVRAKITGKWVPRDEYQALFPIGMGKRYAGSHFVTAHSSPDLDTTVASFWGWVDAFSARVGEGLHLWNVPGGPPESQVEIDFLFQRIFGEGVFQHLAKTRTSLGVSGIDLMTQKGLARTGIDASIFTIDHTRTQAIVLVDEEGFYLGDWRSLDVEGVRLVISLLNNCMRWFETHLHFKLISLLAKEDFSIKDLDAFIDEVFLPKIGDCEPAKEFTDKQRVYLDHYLNRVLKVKKGIHSSFEEFAKAMKSLSLADFQKFFDLLENLHTSSIFDRTGFLVENRPRLFHTLEKVISGLEKAIRSVRMYVERLEIGLQIKQCVLESVPHFVSYRAEVEEIRSKMGNYPYLTVTSSDAAGRLIPLGIIPAGDMHKNILGTVTLRDFCNREETKIPSYLEVISVIDHHKSHLQTSSAAMVLISDSQSSNVLCAEIAFQLNDKFSAGGMSEKEIEKQIAEMQKNSASQERKRIYRRLLQRLLAIDGRKGFFIDPLREYVEYLHFLYAIIDDTDLLTKVSVRDLECVVELLNRLKSLMLKKEVEILNLSDLKRDEHFSAKAARRILQHPDMYSLYSKMYLAREKAIEANITYCAEGKPSSIFVDTKDQNDCARVGQTKLFKKNIPLFVKQVAKLRKQWCKMAHDVWKDRPEVDLHLHMISTVAGAEDLYAGIEGNYKHKDELWLWIPFTEGGIQHLKSFLNAFRSCPQIVHNTLEVELYGHQAQEYGQIFKESFLSLPQEIHDEKQAVSLAVLKYDAGSINSRKAMISPYLPKIVE